MKLIFGIEIWNLKFGKGNGFWTGVRVMSFFLLRACARLRAVYYIII